MKTRDKIFLMVIGAIAILAVVWLMLVAPERRRAASLGGQVAQARSQLASAQSTYQAAKAAQAQYPTAYASMVELGKAVPPGDEVASLVYQLAQASDNKSVDFSSITTGQTGAGGAPTPAPAAPTAAGASVGAAAFKAMPFTFHFTGSFFSLYHLLNRLNGFTMQTDNGQLKVSGRLLTIDGASLDIAGATGPSTAGAGTGAELSGTVTATAYVLPASQATAAAPGLPGAPAAQPTAGSSSTPTPAPAMARVTP